MEQIKQSNKVLDVLNTEESAQILKTITPKHPALNRLHSELLNENGIKAITSYDRMHHRHSRS